MAKYRKKPVVIEAWPVRELDAAAAGNWSALPKAVADHYEKGNILFIGAREGLDVLTLEGRLHAEPTDMLIQGVKGQFYPCKPDIFAATYDPEP